MQHARIMPGLVLCQLRFLFEYHDTTLGKPLCQVVSGREPDNPPTNDGHVYLLHGLSSTSLSGPAASPRRAQGHIYTLPPRRTPTSAQEYSIQDNVLFSA